MSDKLSFSCAATVQSGKLEVLDRTHLRAWASQLGDGVDLLLTIEEAEQGRSDKANRYYWGHVLAEIARHTGHTPEEIHDAMCQQFIPNEHRRVEFFNALTGQSLVVESDSRRSSKLSREEFYTFVEAVRQWAAEFLGVVTDDPDREYWRRKKAA